MYQDLSFEDLLKPVGYNTAEILIADDCQLNIVAVRSLLLQFDCRSDFCNDGQEAIEAVKARY